MIHELKTHQPFWDAIAEGRKTFEVRKNDRGFQVGDKLVLLRTDADSGRYVDAEGAHKATSAKAARIVATVTYVLSGWGIEQGYVCMGIDVGAGSPNLKFGDLEVDVSGHRVWVSGEELRLSALEFRLLTTLLSHAGRVQSRDALLSDVWGMPADMTTRTVDIHVARLRKRLGEAGKYVETLRGVGYRFRVPGAD